MKLEPLRNNIVVLPNDVKEKTDGGIYIPQTVDQQATVVATVVSVGSGSR